MTGDDLTPQPSEPASPGPAPLPAVPKGWRAGGPRLGHIVTGAVLVLIGVGWLLEALDLAHVPWRVLLPSALILVGLALALGARTGRHGGLVAVGAVLTVLVLLAGAIEMLVDVPLAGGVGEKNHRPGYPVADAYRWGVGKMTLDLRGVEGLAGEEVAASVVLGELVVYVPDDLPLVITARAGAGEVQVLGTTTAGLDADLACAGTTRDLDCSGSGGSAERALELDLEVAVGRVEVRR